MTEGAENAPSAVSEMILSMLPFAVEAGVSVNEFWNMTPAEIFAVTKHYSERQKRLIKTQVSLNYDLAIMINNAVAGKLKSKYELYYDLFEEEAKTDALAKLKATMLEYAAANNDKRRKAEGGEV